MKNKCLIISLKYHAGHRSHIVATYRLFNDLGYDSYLHINTNFLSNVEDCDFNTCNKIGFGDYNRYKLVVVLFPSFKNNCELSCAKFMCCLIFSDNSSGCSNAHSKIWVSSTIGLFMLCVPLFVN